MVNESHAIDSADRVDAKDRVDVLRFEQLPKLVPCIVRTHSIFDRLPQLVECAFFFQFYFRVFIIPLKGFITYIFPYFARFERRADSISVVGQGTVDNPRIISAVDSSRTFFDRNIEAFQQRAKLSVGRAFVISQARPDDGRDPLLDIPLGIIHFPQALPVRQFLPLDTRLQAVFTLQITQYLHRTSGLEIMREFAALLIDAQRHDMEMLSGNVLVLENDIRLFAVTHAFHVLTGDFPELFVCQPVLR